jgi:hypothetical protein
MCTWVEQAVQIQVSTDFIPAYVVECAIVPRGDIYQGNNKWTSSWQPHLEIEVYPSYGCKNSTFLYYTGNDQVEITMVADSRSHTVTVSYGDLWLRGTITAFTKYEAMNATILPGGGVATF